MNMQYQDFELAKTAVIKKFNRNSHSSISAAFRNIRKKNRFSYIGDFPLLQMLTATATKLGYKATRGQLTYALNQSNDLKTLPKHVKKALLDELQNITHVQIKKVKNPNRHKKIKNPVITPIIKKKK